MSFWNILAGLLGGGAGAAASSQGGRDYMFGKEGGIEQASKFSPQQQQMFEQLMPLLQGAQGEGMEWLQQILSGDEDAFAKFEAPMKRQFEQETMPGIAERFAGAGSHGSLSSSGLNQSMGQAGRELSESLAGLRGGLQQNAMSQLQGLMGQGYQSTFENMYRQPTTGLVGGMMQGAGQGFGKMAGAYLGA